MNAIPVALRNRLETFTRAGDLSLVNSRRPGGHSHLSSRKIYISEARLQALRVRRQRLDQLCIPLRYLVATVASLTSIRLLVSSRWPGGQSHLSSRKIYILRKPPSVNSRWQVARWPGGHSYLSSRKIYISENGLRLRGCGLSAKHRSASRSISLSYVVATAATLATGFFWRR